MIKAIFFDLYHTLIRYNPPREEILAGTLAKTGIEMSPKSLRRPMVSADEFFYQENARQPMSRRSDAENQAMWAKYQTIVLTEAGIEPKPELIKAILGDMQKARFELVLFDDVLPTLSGLSHKGLALGLISNADRDVSPLLDKLGISSWLKVLLTSKEAGASKPQPEIFREGVRRAGVATHETLYVGDQYQVDVLGARGAGLQGLLLDRGGYFEEVPADEKIQSLNELLDRV